MSGRRAIGVKVPAVLLALIAASALSAGCGSGRAGAPPAGAARDRTEDPDLAAARAAASPEFESQADALAAGVYEPFVHPDSVRPAPGGPPASSTERPAPAPLEPGPDPSTEELLGTLPEIGPYNAETESRVPPSGGDWTIQLGAFDTETGAFVRIRQIAGDFPEHPRWFERDGERVRVFVGRFATREEAEIERARVAAAGYGDAWVTRVP